MTRFPTLSVSHADTYTVTANAIFFLSFIHSTLSHRARLETLTECAECLRLSRSRSNTKVKNRAIRDVSQKLVSLSFSVSYSQRYLFHANPDTNRNANPTNPNGNRKQ